jgi:protein involved in polysaccharide export with SLBB domain
VFKKYICFLILICFSSTALFAQTGDQSEKLMKEIKSPAGQRFLKTAEGKKLLEKDGKESEKKEAEAPPDLEKKAATEKVAVELEENPLSEIETALSKNLLLEKKEPLRQYGYDAFKSTVASFTPAEDVPVGPDYIIGPGDSFNVTLWGITEGIFKVKVNREGDIILPKVGVVKVAGLTYGELKPFVEQQLGRYYESVNVGITIDTLRTIRVYVVGEVTQPGSYSMSSLSTVYSALFAAGGPTKKGTLRKVQLLRNGVVIANLDLYKFLLKGDKSQDKELQSGDTVFVPIIGGVAGISGGVYRPAIYELKGKTDLAEFISLAGGFLPTGYLSRVQVERVVAHEKRIIRDENVSRGRGGEPLGLSIQNMDLVKISPIFEKVSNIIYLEGEVKYPGSYELKPGMRLKDLLPGASLFTLSSDFSYLEIVRIDPNTRQTQIFSINYEKVLSGDDRQNYLLQPLDRIMVFSKEKEKEKITLKGEVLRPGEYAITPGERLSSLLTRAGGFTENAYFFGAKLLRLSAKDIQQKRMQQLVEKTKLNILQRGRELIGGALTAVERTVKEAELKKSEEILKILETHAQEGRVIINLFALDKFAGSSDDLGLEAGDEIVIPKILNTINVLGEVYNPTSLIYQPKKMVSYYLSRVGGLTKHADNASLYVIRADGSVASRDQNINIANLELFPGDSILVPEKIELFNLWAWFKDWTHWIYEMSIAFAVIATYLKK